MVITTGEEAPAELPCAVGCPWSQGRPLEAPVKVQDCEEQLLQGQGEHEQCS